MIIIYDWLLKYREIENKITYLEFSLRDYKAELKRWVYGDLSRVKIKKESKGAKVEQRIKEVEEELEYLNNRKKELLEIINEFDDVENKILIGKYVEGKKLDTIAHEIGYSSGHVRRMHANLMKMIRYKYK